MTRDCQKHTGRVDGNTIRGTTSSGGELDRNEASELSRKNLPTVQ